MGFKISFFKFLGILFFLIIDLTKELNSLDQENKETIFSYLEAIANADGDLAQEELNILNEIKKIWEIKK